MSAPAIDRLGSAEPQTSQDCHPHVLGVSKKRTRVRKPNPDLEETSSSWSPLALASCFLGPLSPVHFDGSRGSEDIK